MSLQKSDVTIIIPSMFTERNNFARGECLTSLRESGFPMSNVIVAFNDVGDDYLKFTDTDYQPIYISEQGQCRAVNQASDHVETEWLMVSNDDMIYPPDWFERLTNFIDVTYVDCVSPQLIEPREGAPTFEVHFCGGVGGDWDKQKFLYYAKNEHLPITETWQGVRSGFNLPFLIRKKIWDLVGGYDTAYDPWSSNSDSDLEYKLKLAGVEMWQNTSCPVYHFSQTSGTFHPDNQSYWQKNWDYFIEKWGFERAGSPEIWEASFEIPYEKLKFKPDWAVIPEEEEL